MFDIQMVWPGNRHDMIVELEEKGSYGSLLYLGSPHLCLLLLTVALSQHWVNHPICEFKWTSIGRVCGGDRSGQEILTTVGLRLFVFKVIDN